MVKMIVSRLIQFPLIMAAVFLIAFMLAWLVPGDPLQQPEGRRPPVEVQEAMKRQYNLDDPWRFLASYLDSASGLKFVRERLDGTADARAEQARRQGLAAPEPVVFDLGPSLHYRDQRVNDILASALPVSITLGAGAMAIALAIGTLAGLVGAVRPGSLADLGTLAVALVGISLPSFVIGTALLMLLSVAIPLFPIATWGPHGAVLPMLTLALPPAAYIARLTRVGLLDVMGQDFIRTARAKGAGEARVLLRHALKNAFLPVLSYLGPATAAAMTGSFVVERVFTVPGLGQHFVNAVINKDLFLILGLVLVFSAILVLFNLVVDVLYRWVDPRIS